MRQIWKGAVLSLVLLMVFAGGLGACSRAEHAGKAVVVEFEDHETDLNPYRTRMIVSPGYVRFDDGNNGPDFVLFDRHANVIYSSSSTDQRILVVKGDARKHALPGKLVSRVEEGTEKLPDVSGRHVMHHKLMVNKQLCYDVYSAAGLLPKVVEAMREFQQALVAQHYDLLQKTPAGMVSDCDQFNNVYRPAAFLDFGFPIRSTNSGGRMRQLVDYHEDQKINPAWFVLPEGYEKFTIASMRGG
jgi:hypothetical protein